MQDENGDGSGDGNESSSGDGNGEEYGNEDGNDGGIGEDGEEAKSTRNRTTAVDAMWETGEA